MAYVILSTSLVSAVVSKFKAEAGAVAAARAQQDKAIQACLDAMTIACVGSKAEFMKGNSKSNTARAEVKALFDKLVEGKFLAKSSAAMYQSSFWIAFENGVPFKRDLASKAKPETVKTETTGKTGKVETTDRAALDATLNKVIKQARLLGLTEFAVSILDLALESLDKFVEVVEPGTAKL